MTAMTAVGPDFSFTAAGLADLPDDGREYELRDGCLVVRGPEPFTVDDLDAMSDDRLRYEPVDGIVYVSPPPAGRISSCWERSSWSCAPPARRTSGWG